MTKAVLAGTLAVSALGSVGAIPAQADRYCDRDYYRVRSYDRCYDRECDRPYYRDRYEYRDCDRHRYYDDYRYRHDGRRVEVEIRVRDRDYRRF